jgi:hypothetical protein
LHYKGFLLYINKNKNMADLVQEEQQQVVVGIDDKRVHLEQGEKDMGPVTGNSIHRSSSRPQLDVSKAEIQSNVEDKYPTILLPNQSDDLSHLALDIGGMYACNLSIIWLFKLFAFLTIMIFVLFILLLYMVFVVCEMYRKTNSFN